MSIAIVQSLGFTYNQRGRRVEALSNVSFEIPSHQSIAITGSSGSGKSTLLSLIGGFLRPTSGSCCILGRDPSTMTSSEKADFRANSLGCVFQQLSLLPHLTLLENVTLGVDHLPSSDRLAWQERAIDLMSRVGIAELAGRRPSEVSGGQAQRAAVARSLLRRPSLLLADEPTGSLDAETASDIVSLMREMCADNCTLIVVTHSEEVASRMSRRISLSHGQLQSDSSVRIS